MLAAMAGECCEFQYRYPPPHEDLGPGCQFSKEMAFYPCGVKTYCRFHLPTEHGDGSPTYKAKWSKDDIEVKSFNAAIEEIIETAAKSEQPANLTGVVFPSDTAFDERELPESLWYEARFRATASFHNTRFSGSAKFDGALFSGSANFSYARFRSRAEFVAARFSSSTHFHGARFSEFTSFSGARFSGFVGFDGARFSSDVWFALARFSNVVRFTHARFSRNAWFNDARYSGDAMFHDTRFLGAVDFSGSRDNDDPLRNDADEGEPGVFYRLVLSGGRFEGVANFNNRTFKQVADFSGRVFVQPPKFHGASLHQGTIWRGATFGGTDNPDAEQDYRTLRLAMEQIRDRPQEGVFFALEQRAMRHQAEWWQLRKWLSYGYDWTCDYGRSTGRPLAWLGAFTVLFFMAYGWFAQGYFAQPANAEQLLTLALHQIVKPFAVWGPVKGSSEFLLTLSEDRLFLYRLIAAVQSILSLSFIGLFALALRWQFRRG